MSDTTPGDLHPMPMPTPKCPICGGGMFPAPMHKAVEKVTSVFRCTKCGVDYPVAKKAL